MGEKEGQGQIHLKGKWGLIGKVYEKGSEMWEKTQARVSRGPGGTAKMRLRKRDSNAFASARVATRRSVVTFGQNDVGGLAVKRDWRGLEERKARWRRWETNRGVQPLREASR